MQLLKPAAWLLASFSMMSVANAQSAPPAEPPSLAPGMTQAVDVSGTYAGTWGAATLHQDGEHVTGTYSYQHGEIDGMLDGNTLHFTWRENARSGHGVLVIASDGQLIGSWGTNASDQNGGLWRLKRSASAAPVTACACDAAPPPTTYVASVDPTLPDPAATTAPVAGTWMFDMRFPWDVTVTPGNTGIGMGGIGFDLGRRLTNTWYLGASADWENELLLGNAESSDGPVDINRFRLGGEARYNFHEGTAAVSVNDGPSTPVPRHDWIGFRGGAETIDGWTHTGEFADVTLGMDAQVSPGFQMGMYLSAGVSFEPAAAYGNTTPMMTGTTPAALDAVVTPPATTSSSTLVSPYFTFGMNLGFG